MPRKQDQCLGPRCRTAEVGTGLHLIHQRLHDSARRAGTQRQFLEEVVGGFIRGRQGRAIDGQALPWCHCAVFLWHDRARALRGVQIMAWAHEPGGADGGHNGASVQGNNCIPSFSMLSVRTVWLPSRGRLQTGPTALSAGLRDMVPKTTSWRLRWREHRIRLIKPFMTELIGHKEHREFLCVRLGAIGAQALQFHGLHLGNINTDGEGHL